MYYYNTLAQETDPPVDDKQVSISALHAKALSGFHNEKLLSLDQKICQGNLRLDKMRRGKPLSILMNEEENIKVSGSMKYAISV